MLDVGCGNGATTLMLADAVGATGEAVGIDLSRAMVEQARARAEAASAVSARFEVADAQVDDLEGPYDAAVSRFGVMFFEDVDEACANIVSALGPSGRVVFACWRAAAENEWVRVLMGAAAEHVPLPDMAADAPGPFRYGDPAPLVRALERGGLGDVTATPFDAPIPFGGHGSLDDVMDHVRASGMLRRVIGDADADVKKRVLTSVRDALAPHATAEGVVLDAAAWIVSGRRR
jgi:SAM-dependent methyltransferase